MLSIRGEGKVKCTRDRLKPLVNDFNEWAHSHALVMAEASADNIESASLWCRAYTLRAYRSTKLSPCQSPTDWSCVDVGLLSYKAWTQWSWCEWFRVNKAAWWSLWLAVHVDAVYSVFSLPPHPSVLEPRLDLLLAQLDQVGDLEATVSAEIAAEMKLFLQLQSLPPTVRRSQPPRLLLLQLVLLLMMIRRKMTSLMMSVEMLRRFTATWCNCCICIIRTDELHLNRSIITSERVASIITIE